VQAITLAVKIEAAQGKTNDALETMKTALKATPTDPRVHFDLDWRTTMRAMRRRRKSNGRAR